MVLIADGTDPGDDFPLKKTYDPKLKKMVTIYASSPLDLDGDDEPDINYSATKENISNIFDKLGETLNQEDNLFIFVTDHGARDKQNPKRAYICLWEKEKLYDYELAKELSKIKAKYISVCMEQCYSGGFIDDLTANNRIIATACQYDEVSWSSAQTDSQYNEFVYHWTAAVLGKYPNGKIANADRNQDGFVSMEEAFIFAKNQDSYKSYFKYKNRWVKETPQYSSTPANLGEYISLSKNNDIDIPDEFTIKVSSEVNKDTEEGNITIKVNGSLGDIYEYNLINEQASNPWIKEYQGFITPENPIIKNIPLGTYKLKLKSLTKKNLSKKSILTKSDNPKNMGIISWIHHTGDQSAFLIKPKRDTYIRYMNIPGEGARGISISNNYLLEIEDYPIMPSKAKLKDGDRITIKVTDDNLLKYWINEESRGRILRLPFKPIFYSLTGGEKITEKISNFESVFYIQGKENIKGLCIKGFSVWDKEVSDYFEHIPSYEYEKTLTLLSENNIFNKSNKLSNTIFYISQDGVDKRCNATIEGLDSDKGATLYIYNSFGKLIQSIQIPPNNKKVSIIVPSSGLYIFKVQTKTESLTYKKYIR